MTVSECISAVLTIFGPPLVVFFVFIAKEPLKVIVMTASAFFWLIALLCSSLLWLAVVPLHKTPAFALVFSVLFQEIMRVFLFYVVRRAELGLQKISMFENLSTDADADPPAHSDSSEEYAHPNVNPANAVGPFGEGSSLTQRTEPIVAQLPPTLNRLNEKEGVLSPRSLAYVSGLGFGLMYGVFASVNMLSDMAGPGTVGLKNDPPEFFIISALIILAMIFLQTFWCIITFEAIHVRKLSHLLVVVLMHMFLSCLTLVNQSSPAGAIAVTCVCYSALLICMLWSFIILGGVLPRQLQCLRRL